MDRKESTVDIIVKINQYNKGELPDYELIREVCAYFDSIKNEPLTDADKQFLYYIANQIGIPQYYDTLKKFDQNTELENISLQTFADIVQEAKLHTAKDTKIHRYQMNILNRFREGLKNRYFLSASTSFGKTFLVYEVIRKMGYSNVLLMFPSIALLSENLEKIYSRPEYAWIKEEYKIHTITSISEIGEKNIFLYTPERYLSFLDVSQFKNLPIDFVFVDEVYKLDNEYIVDEEIKENERDVAYRLALYYSLLNSQTDCLLAGPFIKFSQPTDDDYNRSFGRFLEKYSIELLDYNNYEIVNKGREKITIRGGKTRTYLNFLRDKNDLEENVIVYCSRKSDVERYAKAIVANAEFPEIDIRSFEDFYQHVTHIFEGAEEWIVAKALRKGIGIHHGLVPKYIQKEIINLFNAGQLKVLISTTTITEGVNTTAKNVLITYYKKGTKKLKVFDAKNIEGRAGRFLEHYKGNVYYMDSEYEDIRESKGESIKHKYYDEQAPKQDIDLFYVDRQYLNQEDIRRKQEMEAMQIQEQIPDDILGQYKVISKRDKILMYQNICRLSAHELSYIEELIHHYQYRKNIVYRGFEVIVSLLQPFVRHSDLKSMMKNTPQNQQESYSPLTRKVYAYFQNGLTESINYYKNQPKTTVDEAVKKATYFVYNILRYQVVKYFGAFNVMYKYYKARRSGIAIEQVTGIDAMLIRMEYNANTQKGRIASDYGVPNNVLKYYEATEEDKDVIKKSFDNYEIALFNKIDSFI